MKAIARYLFVIFSLAPITLFAQVTPPCGTPPPPGAEACQTTCVYCDFDGYMGINNGTPSGGDVVCGSIFIHNDQWFGFVAGSDFISIDVLTSNCNNGNGLQSAFFDACGEDALVCNPGVQGGEGQPLNLSWGGFVPGQTYYLMIDGWSNDVCNYEIDVIAGSITPPPPGQAIQPMGPTQVCPGAQVTYTIPPIEGAGYYRWTAPAGSSINGLGNVVTFPAPGGQQVEIVFGSLSGQVCVEVGNACHPPTQACIVVINQPIPPTPLEPVVICQEELPFFWDQPPFTTIGAPGTYTLSSLPFESLLGCDSFVRQNITVRSTPSVNIGVQYFCEGTCFEINGNTYCDTGGPFTERMESSVGCDSLVRFTVVKISSNATILPVSPLSCDNPVITLNGAGSSTGFGVTYAWFNASGNQIGNQITQNVAEPGTYTLVVQSVGGPTTCRDSATIVVTGSNTPPGANPVGGVIGCLATNQTITLQSNSPTQGVTYLWTGPGINAQNFNLPGPVIDTPGTYTLIVTNPLNNCTSTGTAIVVADNTPPQAQAVGGVITCNDPLVGINVLTDAPSAGFQWNGPAIVPGQETFQNPDVGGVGTYAVTVTNLINGCTQTSQTTVTANTQVPVANAGPDRVLTCTTSSVTLSGSGDAQGAPLSYFWTGPGITPLNEQSQEPVVSVPGLYILTVFNDDNGCADTDTMEVSLNITPPIAEAGPNRLITCVVTNVELDGSMSSSGPGFTAFWAGPGINVNNQQLYTPSVTFPGTYILRITDLNNGCTATDNVTVNFNITPPVASAGPAQILDCATAGVVLQGSGMPGNVTFRWTGPGITPVNQNQSQPLVSQPGVYTLRVTNPVNGCTDTDEVIITQDDDLPIANAGPDQLLSCVVSQITINGSGSSSGVNIAYNWSGPGIASPNDTVQSPTGILLPGTYYLSVVNTDNSCVSADSMIITVDTIPPIANAGPDRVLNCYNSGSDTLQAGNSSSGPGFEIFWKGPGITAGNQNQLRPVVSVPGQYLLQVTNTVNGCTAVSEVFVDENQDYPQAEAGVDQVLNCVIDSITLGGNSSSGPDIQYNWVGPGIQPGGTGAPGPVVEQPGTYTLVVTNTVNGCSDTDQTDVFLDVTYPTIAAGPDGVLTCTDPTFTLDGSGSSSGSLFVYTWQGPDIIPGNQNDVSVEVAIPGVYILSVRNTKNSCVSLDTVLLDLDQADPIADAGMVQTINCYAPVVRLDGSASSMGPRFVYLWMGPGVLPDSAALQSAPAIQGGLYTLLVTDIQNGCTATATVSVLVDTADPVADAGSGFTLTCLQNTGTIDGSGSSTGQQYGYRWTGTGINAGNINLQLPMVSDSGWYNLVVTDLGNGCTATDSVYVSLDADFPFTEAGPNRTITCAVDTVRLDGSLSLSGSGISYLWTGPGIVPGEETGISPRVTVPGLYLLTVSNANNGCSRTDFVNVLEDIAEPFADAGLDQVINCNTPSGVTISAAKSDLGLGYTLAWTGPGINVSNQGAVEPQINLPGLYILAITDQSNGCRSLDTAIVQLDVAPPVANAGPDRMLTCSDISVVLTASQSTPAGLLDFTWSGPGINSNNINQTGAIVNEPGLYTLTVTNTANGCTAIDQVQVGTDLQAPQLTLFGDTITCLKPVGTLSASSNLPGTTYAWIGPGITASTATLSSPPVSEPGLYYVTATAPNGCTSQGTVSAVLDGSIPNGAAEGAVINCYGMGAAVLQGQVLTPDATSVWTGPGGFTSTQLTNSVTVPGIYTLTITSLNGCTKAISVSVTANLTPPVAVAQPTGGIGCNAQPITISTQGSSAGFGFSYQTTTVNGNIVSGANAAVPQVNLPGQYSFIVTNQVNGCRDTADFTVVSDPAVPSAMVLDIRNIRCTGDVNGSIRVSGVVSGTPPFQYTLNGVTNGSGLFENLGRSTYILELEDAQGCYLDTLVEIIEPGPLSVDLGPDLTIQLGASVTVEALLDYTTPLASIIWVPEAPCVSTCLAYTAEPLSSYLQTITVVDSNGCKATDRVTIIVRKDRLVYVPNVFNPESNSPENALFQVFAGTGVVRIRQFRVFDRWGGMIFRADDYMPGDPNAAWNGLINGRESDNDVYIWYAEVEFSDGEVITYSGDVALVRQ
jgi:hypothetical protein